MKPSLAFLFLVILATTSCDDLPKRKQTLQQKQKELDTGTLNDKNIYSAKEVGWTVLLPDNWEVLTKREKFNISEKGKKLMEETYNTNIDDSKLINLINIQKNKFNSMLSTIEPFDESTDGDYDDHNIFIHNFLKDVYKEKKIPAEYELGAVRIDGVMFDRFTVKIFSPDKKKVILEQRMFSALINGYDFSMNINFNNSADEETLMKVVIGSKFSIKK